MGLTRIGNDLLPGLTTDTGNIGDIRVRASANCRVNHFELEVRPQHVVGGQVQAASAIGELERQPSS